MLAKLCLSELKFVFIFKVYGYRGSPCKTYAWNVGNIAWLWDDNFITGVYKGTKSQVDSFGASYCN